ncbi:SAM-dependent methyltransferase [Paenibacillus polymyxa]|uniref:SAM-dependent methyltransferase n=1 Tax=Paenibacillus polymyxa TaxID=1406 RepID=UPI0006C6F0B9|nr:methyltransferase domain-containing protein [Paenibacillus polymyxa]KOS03139.1 methyltransferase [Paenibacillus polymyxa]
MIRRDLDDVDFIRANLMGPSSIIMFEELSKNLPLQKGMRVLDLGCGTGLTSIYLAQKFGLTVFAVDLWISATENYRRFREFGLESQIIPIHAEACHLPFAEQYFDAVISVDAYQYFGANEQYLDDHLTPLVKEGGKLAIAMPGIKMEFDGVIPVELQPFLSLSEVDNQWHTCDWWRKLWQQSPNIYVESVREMRCFSKAWYEWLQCNNDYARANNALLNADDGKYMNLISLIATKK